MRILKIVLGILLLSHALCVAQLRLPRLISDGMVLQRDQSLRLWGWASPQEKVSLLFKNKQYKTQADATGKWEIKLPAQPAGGPFDLFFRGKNEVKVSNVLFGDVWICAGQSNMVIPMERVKEKYPEDIASANYPEIRLFFVATLTDLQQKRDDFPSGSWKVANPKDVLQFSAIAYFFARNLYEKYHVPIGLINSSVGGTPIEAWIGEEGLTKFPELTATLQKNKDSLYVKSLLKQMAAANTPRKSQDKGMSETIPWYSVDYVPKGWRRMNVPGYWEDQGIKDLNGVVWYRKEIDVPASMTGVSAKLFLGRIVDADIAYVNGKQVGNITYQYPPRRYEIPAGVLKEGKNTLVVRVVNQAGKGGFVPDKNYSLVANGQVVDIKGDWWCKVGEAFPPAKDNGVNFSAQNQPSALFNAMIAPLVSTAAKGFLWYQGESNTGNPEPYRALLPTLVQDWRSRWGQGDLPFFGVQLANFMEVDYLPSESQWAVLREGQLNLLSVPNTALAVTIDLGEWNDIHPLNKKDIGYRLSLAAQKLAYGDQNVVHSGPLLTSATSENGKIRLRFDQTGSGIVSKDDDELRWFAVAGADKKFVWAQARIEGKNEIVVWNDTVSAPLYVRYAWADNPENVNFYNKEGLPASPFRTDEPAKR
ncbi:sialate O-acetylesterase [Runella defluvii]|uniref:Sialate O-acetylesterase n=1 Tax=Runella defluvii TaxID=370973 RepID=A0A7W5ZMF4_9BACT|nr:sialate O-acetylesterase [Runella defluvii]MBB3838429.1 sialate O-acetylesterase [Runella defluvii]